jgi:hypothetical protein
LWNVVFEFHHGFANILGNGLDVVRRRSAHVRMAQNPLNDHVRYTKPVQVAPEAATRRVAIFSIYTPGSGHFGHTFWRINWGQNYLSQLSDETGGESYYLGSEAPVSFSPYLDDVSHRLLHQYLLTFLAEPVSKAGMQSVKLRTEVSNAELVAADRVYVPASE